MMTRLTEPAGLFPAYIPSAISTNPPLPSPHMDHNKPVDSATILSNTRREMERRKIMHNLSHYVQGNLFSAPVESILKEGGRVLDIQESNGNWATDLANLYPNTSVTAIDLCNVYIKDSIPANCTFMDCTVDQPLPFDDASFDFVFMRRTTLIVSTDTRNRVLLPEVKRVLKPGGYFEWMEPDSAFTGGPKATQFAHDAIVVMEGRGFDGRLGLHHHEDTAALGFMIVNCTVLGVSVGYAAGNVVARSFGNANHAALQSSRQWLVNAWQITEEEYDQRVAEVEHEWNHVQAATTKQQTVIARKIQNTNVEDPN